MKAMTKGGLRLWFVANAVMLALRENVTAAEAVSMLLKPLPDGELGEVEKTLMLWDGDQHDDIVMMVGASASNIEDAALQSVLTLYTTILNAERDDHYAPGSTPGVSGVFAGCVVSIIHGRSGYFYAVDRYPGDQNHEHYGNAYDAAHALAVAISAVGANLPIDTDLSIYGNEPHGDDEEDTRPAPSIFPFNPSQN